MEAAGGGGGQRDAGGGGGQKKNMNFRGKNKITKSNLLIGKVSY